MNKKGNEGNPWHALAMVGALGFEVGLSTAAGYFIGSWIAPSSSGWKIAGVFTGLIVGLLIAILLVKKALENKNG
ncbi:AtpZ/AtpI family protein [Cohnella algarum]|uniref:AtpZ/AtpI family protein n=1 Tax=Cohnella algarum TaxID=2044859 RepID=UPI00196789A7|nr:AtpZ/AtpI family protein [Cohnella algarum]MBN2980734.1 AtpZ/AtpI family protein [Cohnella algarum]